MSIYSSRLRALLNVAVLLLLLEPKARAQQIQGCDLVSCPLDQYGRQYCPIGNITASNIGVTNFTTSLSPEPFTWTTTLSSSDIQRNHSLTAYERGYLLGLPPSLDLESVKSLTGCALFFDGISSKLKFPGNFTGGDIGTCQDAMGSSCVADIQTQTRSILAHFATTAEAESSLCANLESALRDKPPTSCNFVQGGSWGSIHAREIQRSTLPNPLKPSSCHPTTGFNYSLRLIDTYDLISGTVYDVVQPFAYGVTPILTVLLPQNLTERGEGQSNVELHLSCLKPLVQETGPHMVLGGISAVHPGWHSSFIIVLIAGIIGLASLF